jgi:hypothetical protein
MLRIHGRLVLLFLPLVSCFVGIIQAQCDRGSLPCITQPSNTQKQISGKGTANTTVQIKVNSAAVGSPTVGSDGTFTLQLTSELKQGYTVQVDNQDSVTVAAAEKGSSLYTLGLAGFNATASSSSGPSAQYFVTFDLVTPLPWVFKKGCPKDDENPVSQKCWLWLNPRIASIPAASSTALSSLTSASSLTTGISSQNVSQITQSFEFQGGLVFYFKKPTEGRLFGWDKSWGRTTAGLLIGGGSVTPFNSISGATEYGLNANLAEQFNQMPKLAGTYSELATALCSYGYVPVATAAPCPPTPSTKPTSVAFVFPNRSRFYRDYFAGFRISTFYSTGSCSGSKPTGCELSNTYPGTFDIRFGQDETVTGGHLRGFITTVAASYPLPGTNGIVRVFGSSSLRVSKNQNTTALVLIPSTSFISLDNPTVAVQPIYPSDQDYYRLGVGVDLISLISTKFGK